MTTDVEIEQQLREAFASRAERTVVREPEPTPVSSRVPSQLSGRSWRPLAGVAAASVVLVGGLLVVRNTTSETPPAATVPPSSIEPVAGSVEVIADRQAIDLDAWQPLPEAGDTGLRFLVLDIDQLPDELELVEQNASTFLGAPADQPFYVSTNRLAAASGNDLFVSIEAYEFALCAQLDVANEPTGDPSTGSSGDSVVPPDALPPAISVNGIEASVVAGSLCWKPEPGVYASVRFEGPDADDVDAEAAEQLAVAAAGLRFAEVDRLPASTWVERAPDAVEVAPEDPDFAGLLGGTEWSATVSNSTLRSMQIYVNGTADSGFEHDRLSQPNDFPTATGEVSIDGVPGAGAMVYGYVMPEAANVTLRSSGDTVSLPLLRRDFESYFAFPVPEGVVIESVEFTDDAGVPIAKLELPHLPAQLGGGYGGNVQIERI